MTRWLQRNQGSDQRQKRPILTVSLRYISVQAWINIEVTEFNLIMHCAFIIAIYSLVFFYIYKKAYGTHSLIHRKAKRNVREGGKVTVGAWSAYFDSLN